MNKERLKVEASRVRWSKIPDPRKFFKPLKMAEHKIEKAELEDPIGIKFRKEFGPLDEFMKQTELRFLQHDQNHDYFALVNPKHCPIHLQSQYNNNVRHQSQPKPKEAIDAKHPINRRSQTHDPQPVKQPPINHVKPIPTPGDVPMVVNSDPKRGKPLESKKKTSESESWKNNFNFSSQAEVDSKVSKFSEEINVPAMMSPLPQKTTTSSPPKIMTKIQQIELSENPLDFSVSEDEMNVEEEDESESPEPASVDNAKESEDCASDGKEDTTEVVRPTNEPGHHSSRPILTEVSVEDGEIIESDFRRGNFRSSSKVRSTADTAPPPANNNILTNDNFRGSKSFDDFMDLESQNEKEAGIDPDDLEEGEIGEDPTKKTVPAGSISSRSSSSDSFMSDDSSDVSEPSPVHSRHDDDRDDGVEQQQQAHPGEKRIIKSHDDVSKERTTAFVSRTPVEETRDQSSFGVVDKHSQSIGISKSSAFEHVKKQPVPVQPKIGPEPQRERLKVETANKIKVEEPPRESPARIPTPAEKKEPPSANLPLPQKPKQEVPAKPSKSVDGKGVKLKIKNVNGSYKTNDDAGKSKTADQAEPVTKPLEKKDKKPDSKTAKKQQEQKLPSNQQGINSAAPPSKVARKKNVVAKENTTADKSEPRLDVKSRKRKGDDLENAVDRSSGILAKIPKLVPNTKLPEVPLVLRFNMTLFAKLEKLDKKRKPEDDVPSVAKKARVESDPNSKDVASKKTKIKKIATNPDKPNSEHDQGVVNKKSKKPKQVATEVITPAASLEDVDKKHRLQEVHKELMDATQQQGDTQAKKPIKKASKPNREEILKKANEALLKGKDVSVNNKKTADQVNGQQFLSAPVNDAGTASSKSSSPVEKHKKESLKNPTKLASSTTPVKSEPCVFVGTLKVTPGAAERDSRLADDSKERQASAADVANKNQSQVEAIRRKAVSHQNNSQFLQTMAKVYQDKNGGGINFGFLLNSIESHVLSFLGVVELAKINEDSLNIRHYNQLISNLEVSIKELDGSAERNRLNFLLHSFSAMVNDYYFNFTFNKDKLLNETAVKEIQTADKNSPRSSPDSTCTNPNNVNQDPHQTNQDPHQANQDPHQANQDPNAGQGQGQVTASDASAVKSLNQAKINLSFLFPYLYNCNSSLKALFKLASEPSCRDLCDRQHLPVDIIHSDLESWSKWFDDVMTRLRSTYQLQCPPLHPSISSAL